MSSDDESVQSIRSDNENDLEVILENGEQTEPPTGETEDATEGTEENRDDEESRKIKPKRIVRNPQPKLNEHTLKGPKGIACLPKYFERVTFKGKGHEEQDLNVLLKTYEYWSHRLFPKFPFSACVERLEKLGHKKITQTHLKRIRYDLFVEEEKQIIDHSSDEENHVEGFVDITDNQFNSLLPATQHAKEPDAPLTEEQLQKIKENKERAEKIRQERLKKIREGAQSSLQQSSYLPSRTSEDVVMEISNNVVESNNVSEDEENNVQKRGKRKNRISSSDSEDITENVLDDFDADKYKENEDRAEEIQTQNEENVQFPEINENESQTNNSKLNDTED